MDVVVIGGGVVGLSVAEALAQRDAEVTVLDAGAFGRGASEGNAGWVSPGLSNPVPAPGVMAQALRWMANPRSPLLVRPSLRRSYLRWSYDFWRSTTASRYSAGMAALSALGTRVLQDYDQLVARGVALEMHDAGLLFVGRTSRGVAAEVAVLRDAQALGYTGEIRQMNREETLVHEPVLTGEIAGSVLAVSERHVRPESVTGGLVEHLTARGVALRPNVAVRAVVREGERWRVDCGDGDGLLTDRVVVAAGWESGALLEPLGVRIPLQGGKGYSVTVSDPVRTPKGAMYLLEDRVAVTPFDGALRLAGTMELGAVNRNLNPGRLQAIEDAGRRMLHGWPTDGSGQRWAGFRPMLPDGLPAIGPVPGLPGLHVATGHAMLGVTLGPTTGAVMAPSILDGSTPLDLVPFSLARFGNRAVSR